MRNNILNDLVNFLGQIIIVIIVIAFILGGLFLLSYGVAYPIVHIFTLNIAPSTLAIGIMCFVVLLSMITGG